MKEPGVGAWWLENMFRPALIAGMMACLTAPTTVFLQWLIPGWNGAYLIVFAFAASLEGILSERLLQKQRITGWGYLASRAAEALILLLLLKLANYVPLGLDQLVADAQKWVSDPYQFVSRLDFFTGPLFLAIWLAALYVARLVIELDVDEGKEAPPPDKTSVEYYIWLTKPPVVRDRQERLGRLGETFLWGGVALLLGSTLVHVLVSSAQVLALPTLLYFALGIALLSQARFSVSYAGWRVQGISIQPGLARRWLAWVGIFLIGVALLALLLPTYYTMGPLKAFLGLLSMLYAALSFLIALVVFLLTLPLLLLNPDMERPEIPDVGPLPAPMPDPGVVGASTPWLEIVASAIFWLVVLAIIIYALRRFLRDRLAVLDRDHTAEGTWWGRFLAWVRALWRRWRAWGQEVQGRLVQRRPEQQRASPLVGRLRRFFFPGRLHPRELVRYFYLSAARRAAEAGQPRSPDQTPHEYQVVLDQKFPDLEPDLEGLTGAFIQARYSNQIVEQKDAEAVKPLWHRIKASLRRRRIPR
ncbi:MAG TPA: DUF4129 domain-containing protein [Anaerolineae bacterium]|nr:DUF4129 domain-containing protein [Anaerolineae bacterium]